MDRNNGRGRCRALAAILCLSLAVNVSLGHGTKSRAFVPLAAPIAWELLQAALMAAGITIASYEAYELVIKDNRYLEAIDAQVKVLNTMYQGLGDRLRGEVGSAVVSDGAYEFVMSEETWTGLLSVSEAIAAGRADASFSLERTVPMASYQEAVREAVMAIPSDRLPLDGHGYRSRDYAVTSSIVEGFTWDKFMAAARTYTGMDEPYVTVVYTAQEWPANPAQGVRAGGCHCLTYAYTKERVHGLQDVGYNNALVLLDSNGDYLEYGYATVAWTTAQYVGGADAWSVTGCRERPTLAVWFTSASEYLFSLDFDAYPMYAQVLVQNGSIASTFPVAVEGAFQSQLRTGTFDVVTPGRFLTDVGTLAGGVAITVPTTFPLADELGKVIADTVPATDVLPKVGVVPVDVADDKVIGKDQTIADAVADAKVDAPAVPATPSVDGFDLSLADFFPFCIPFDFVRFLGVLGAEPEAPRFTFRFPTGFGALGVTYQEYEVSLERFDQVAYWCRRFELLAFIVGLAMATRSVFIRS